MARTTILTAYNQDVQKYIDKGNAEAKRVIIQEIKEDTLKSGINFNRLFPPNSKKLRVLDEVIFMLSVGGICKISRNTLAKNTDSSIRLVSDTVKEIRKLGLFVVGGLADGKNKYIFLYKKHADFKEILASVFYLDAQQTAQQVAQQEKDETVDTTASEGDISSPNNDNSFIFEHEKDILRDSIENEIKQSETIEEYVNNPYQKMLFDYIKNNNYPERLKGVASVIALRVGSNFNEKLYNIARGVVDKLNFKLILGTEIESIPAVFEKMYKDRIKYSGYYEMKTPEPKEKRDTSLYYNWLKEDGSKSPAHIQ